MDNLALSPKARLIIDCILLVGLWIWAIALLKPGLDGPPPWIFLDNLNLLIHEAGHLVFRLFGETSTILGGSLLQCLLPAIFAGYFIYHKDWAGAAFGVFWVGNNLINVSYYIADASTRVLPLLGGDTSGHDWFNLLSRWNLLGYDKLIAQIIYGLGFLALVTPLIFLAGITVLSVSTWRNGKAEAK